MDILNAWWAIIRDGLHHIAPVQGLIIGAIFGLMASSIVSVVLGALGASVVYVAVDALWPVVFAHKAFAMPAFNGAFGHFFLALFFAFLVIIAVIYIAKSLVSSVRG